MPTVGSLFSGIGGLELGLERAGFEIKFQVENDPFCQAVLAKHWPHVARHGDIRSFPLPDTERVDLICGGFPCQPVSVAGKRRAQADERWLWPEFARVVRVLRPRLVLVENVSGLLDGGVGHVLGDLAALGFDAEWDVLPASAFGAPHRRERVFLAAVAGGEPGLGGVFAHGDDGIPRDSQWRAAQGVESGSGWKCWLNAAAAALDWAGSSTWFHRMDDGLPEGLDGYRIHALGNAVVPQVAEWIGRRLMAFLTEPRAWRAEGP